MFCPTARHSSIHPQTMGEGKQYSADQGVDGDGYVCVNWMEEFELFPHL